MPHPGIRTPDMKSPDVPFSAPHFSGLTRSLQDRHWVSPETFQKLLDISSSSYVGRLPAPFRQAVPENPKKVFLALDELAHLLRGVKKVEGVGLKIKIGKSKEPITLESINNGSFGTVYKLTVKDQSFALKIYHHADEADHYGTYGESATGLYFSKKEFKDLAKFHFGNPKAGWGVYEWIAPEMSAASRPGDSIQDYPVNLEDECEDNRLRGIRVDYGGITPESKRPVFKELDGFRLAMASQDKTIQVSAAGHLFNLPEGLRQEAYQMAMSSRNPDVQAGSF